MTSTPAPAPTAPAKIQYDPKKNTKKKKPTHTGREQTQKS